ncbi:MAG: hypothetical protein FWC27_01225, partial [Firmicutes bacterium]|nr:hypothetical protein [Bacillota bacterium]
MEFRSLEEFDRAFFARYGAVADGGSPVGGACSPAGGDPFLREAAPAPSPAALPEQKKKIKAGPAEVLCDVLRHSITVLLVAAVIALAAPQLFGVRLLNVETDSLWPDYTRNTLVWAVPAAFEKIAAGDDVAWQPAAGPAVIHRVIETDGENNALSVKGNDIEIGERIAYSQVLGVVRFHVHRLGPVPERISGMRGI